MGLRRVFDHNGYYRPGLAKPIPIEIDPDWDLRWPLAEELHRRHDFTVFLFYWVYYAVIGYKRLRRIARRLVGLPPIPPRPALRS
jgi:hypothetical protein